MDYLAFADERGEVTKMAAVRSSPSSAAASAQPKDDPETTITRQFDPSTEAATPQPEPTTDWSDDASSTLSRPLNGESESNSDPVREQETIARPHLPILEREDKDTLTRPHDTEILVRRDAVPPPPVTSSDPLATSYDVDVAERSGTSEGFSRGFRGRAPIDPDVATPVHQVVHTPAMGWLPTPPLDSSPPPAPAIRTPLVMITAPEDNLTRVAPMTSLVHPQHRMGKPIPFQPAPFTQHLKLPSGIHRAVLAIPTALLVAALLLVSLRPRPHQTANASGPVQEPTPVLVMTPVELSPPVAPPVAPPTFAAAMVVSPSPTAAPTPAPARVEAPRRRLGRPVVTRPGAIPVRREQ